MNKLQTKVNNCYGYAQCRSPKGVTNYLTCKKPTEIAKQYKMPKIILIEL